MRIVLKLDKSTSGRQALRFPLRLSAELSRLPLDGLRSSSVSGNRLALSSDSAPIEVLSVAEIRTRLALVSSEPGRLPGLFNCHNLCFSALVSVAYSSGG